MTRIIQTSSREAESQALDEAVRVLAGGGLVAFPTETVYGIGVLGNRKEAIERLYQLKGRPKERNLAYFIADREDIFTFVNGLPRPAEKLIARFWPGPLTIVFKTGDKTVGVRFPDAPFARELTRSVKSPLLVTSANLSGEPASIRGSDITGPLLAGLDLVVDAGPTRLGSASTVVLVEGERSEVLRVGCLSREEIAEAQTFTVLFVCTGNTCRSPMAAALFKSEVARHLERRGVAGSAVRLKVLSAGVAAAAGDPASEEAVVAMRRLGVELGPHESQPVTAEIMRDADRILCMTESHRRVLTSLFPSEVRRIRLLNEDGSDVADPMGLPVDAYERCAREMQAELARLLPHILENLMPG
jgi:protein-tyrosine phosphatase